MMNQLKRWVYGTRDEEWHLVGPHDRDWDDGLTDFEMGFFGKERCKEMYLSPRYFTTTHGQKVRW